MLRDSRTSMRYYTNPLRWSKLQTKSWSMFQFRSMTEVTLHNSRARGRFTQRANLRGFSQNVRCARCSRHGHLASNCHSIMPYVAPNLDAVHSVGLVTTNQNLSCRSRLSKVHDSYTPYCATAACYTINGERRDIVYLRDSGSLQTLASKQCFSEGD